MLTVLAPTDAQLSFIAKLCREQGWQYPDAGPVTSEAERPDVETLREQAKWLLTHWTEPAFGRAPTHDVAIALARGVAALVDERDAACGRADRAERRLAQTNADRAQWRERALRAPFQNQGRGRAFRRGGEDTG